MLKETDRKPNIGWSQYHFYEESNFVGGFAAWTNQVAQLVYLESLFVRDHLQNQGHGTKMLRAAIDLFKSEGHKGVCLWVWKNNAHAIHLYQKAGLRFRQFESNRLPTDPKHHTMILEF